MIKMPSRLALNTAMLPRSMTRAEWRHLYRWLRTVNRRGVGFLGV